MLHAMAVAGMRAGGDWRSAAPFRQLFWFGAVEMARMMGDFRFRRFGDRAGGDDQRCERNTDRSTH
jgi:hypothetical protein